MSWRPPRSTLFPYTTLFRSQKQKINRQCNQDRHRISDRTQGDDELTRQNDQCDNVSRIGRQEDRNEQSFRVLQHFLQPLRGSITAFCPVSQSHRVEREQTGFNPGEEKRDQPAGEEENDLHGRAPFAPSPPTQTVFSISNSSIRRRLTRRTVIFSRGVSSCVPTSGKCPSWLKT